jgi:GAF domain-containing protein
VEPVPETEAALAEFMEPDEEDLEEKLRQMAAAVCRIVPECVGMSLTLVKDQLTFTLVASDVDAATVDAAQYLDGGPCLRSDTDSDTRETTIEELLDEDRWTMFAQASAASGIAGSLSLAVINAGQVVGGINLYAATANAFTGHHQELADVLGASAMSAVKDADLSFYTRRQASEAPDRLRNTRDVEIALGVLAARYAETLDAARQRLSRAAARAGVAEPVAARLVILVDFG